MASRNFHTVILFVILWLLAPSRGALPPGAPRWAAFSGTQSLYAQSASSFVELRFVQHLTWIGDEYALRYEVQFEREQAGQYREALREFTSETFIEVSLSPGKYRYRVIPYNFLDQPGKASEWLDIEVLRGVTPTEHEMIMVHPGDKTSRTEITLTPETVIETTEAPTITEFKNQFDVYLGGAWIPLLPIYGENDFFGENLSAVGMAVHLGVISAKPAFLCPGMELAASWRTYAADGNEVQAISFDFGFLGQIRMPKGKTAFNFRAGTGASMRSDVDPVSATGQYSVHANIGVSFLWLIRPHLYLETGADYSQFFTKDFFGFLRPWFGLGYRF